MALMKEEELEFCPQELRKLLLRQNE